MLSKEASPWCSSWWDTRQRREDRHSLRGVAEKEDLDQGNNEKEIKIWEGMSMQGPSGFLYFCRESNLNLGSSILGDFHIRRYILPLQNTEGHLELGELVGP